MTEQAHSIWFKADVDGFDTLVDLALNLRWSWSHGEEELWEPLDPELWELTHNPWLVLLTTSLSRLKSLMADPNYRLKVEEAARTKKDYMQVSHASSDRKWRKEEQWPAFTSDLMTNRS